MLPSEMRLRQNREFRLVYARGKSYPHPVVVLYVLRRPITGAAPSGARFGFVVSKKQGGAVVRNRIKRRLREACRMRLSELRNGPFDLILVGRSKAATAQWNELRDAVELLLQRSKMLKSPDGPTE